MSLISLSRSYGKTKRMVHLITSEDWKIRKILTSYINDFFFHIQKTKDYIHDFRDKINYYGTSLRLVLFQKNLIIFQIHLHLIRMKFLALLCQTSISKIIVFTCNLNVICETWKYWPKNLSRIFWLKKGSFLKFGFEFMVF